MTARAAWLTALLADSIGGPVRILRRAPLGGGDISHTERIETSAGSFVVKTNAAARTGFFRAEADGLAALAASGTSLTIPRVIAWQDDEPGCIVLEDLGRGQPVMGYDERVGRGLAEVHRSRADRFGFSGDGFCGATAQPNPWHDTWITFYARERLGHQLALASAADLLSTGERRQVERLIDRLDSLLVEPAEGPALIHGDLWSGNLHTGADGLPALIDPAAYYAHREAELGMMTLFGGFGARVYAAYDEAFPLEPGWRERNSLYQLYHLMNHLNLFGGGYHGQVMAIVRRYV
jgi:fructosamine-3-kinase